MNQVITAICDEQALLNDKCLPKHCIHKILLDSRRAGQGNIITALISSVHFVAECLNVLKCYTHFANGKLANFKFRLLLYFSNPSMIAYIVEI